MMNAMDGLRVLASMIKRLSPEDINFYIDTEFVITKSEAFRRQLGQVDATEKDLALLDKITPVEMLQFVELCNRPNAQAIMAHKGGNAWLRMNLEGLSDFYSG